MFLDAISNMDPATFDTIVVIALIIVLVFVWAWHTFGGDNIHWS